MKSLAKITFLLFAITITLKLAAQPCTPNTNFPGSQGILPEFLPDAVKDVAYSVVIQYKAPVDTSVSFQNQQIVFKVDSMRPLSVIGLPPGISYQCFNNTCLVKGGQVGCITLSGTPEQAGYYPIKVPVKTSGKIQFIIPIAQTSIDTQGRYSIQVSATTGLVSVVDDRDLMSIYPNPASGYVNIAAKGSEPGRIAIYDMAGKLVKEVDIMADQGEVRLDVSGYRPGLHFAEYVTDHFSARQKFIVR